MRELPAVGRFVRFLVNPGWAPFAVVGIHLILAAWGLTHRFDHLLHFLGGASMAYFLTGCLDWQPSPWMGIPRWARLLVAFTSTCTVALFWEFAEFASDQLRGTSIQQSLSETMLDLLWGVLGATVTLLLTGFPGGWSRQRQESRSRPIP